MPLLAALLGVPTGERYPALTPHAGGAEAADVAGAGRPARGPGGAAAGAGAVRGRALDRPLDARAPGPRDRAHPAAAGPGADHLPAGVPAALDRPGARHHADHEPSGPAPGGRSGRAGHGRQAAAGGGRRADRGAHRRRAAVRRGADQDGAGIGPARGRRRPLRAVRPAAAARDPDDLARLADGPPRPPRAGQGGRADRRRDRPRVQPRAARRGLAAVRRPISAPPSTSWSPPSWSSAAARRPRRPTASSTRWSRTPPTSRCSSPSASSCTPASPQVLEERFPETVRGSARSCSLSICTEAGLVEKAIPYLAQRRAS